MMRRSHEGVEHRLQFPFPYNQYLMTQIQAVLFDYGMVLSGPPDPAAWAQMRSITGLDEEPLHRAYWAHRHPYDRGDLTGQAYWHKVGHDTGIVLTPTQIEGLMAA